MKSTKSVSMLKTPQVVLLGAACAVWAGCQASPSTKGGEEVGSAPQAQEEWECEYACYDPGEVDCDDAAGAAVTACLTPCQDNNCVAACEATYDAAVAACAAAVPACVSACSGGTTTTYTIPGNGGTFGGGYLTLTTANGDVELDITCNYGFAGDNEAFFFADNPSLTAGQVQVTVAIQGQSTENFNDLAYNQGGQDRAFASTFDQGTWPWQGVFTAVEGATTTQWTVSDTGSAGGDCTVTVTTIGGGSATITHP